MRLQHSTIILAGSLSRKKRRFLVVGQFAYNPLIRLFEAPSPEGRGEYPFSLWEKVAQSAG
jgi:hypothetical protein